MNSVREKFAMLIATAFGSGFMPKAPGTAGSVVALLLILVWERGFEIHDPMMNTAVYFITFLFGWWASWRWSKLRNQTDCQEIVIDEVLGYWLAIWMLPHSNLVLATQFVLFRVLDATKPFPIRALDRWGKKFPIGAVQSLMVIVDDLLAGLASLGIGALIVKAIQ